MLKELKVDYLINKSSACIIVNDETRIYSAGTPEFDQVKEMVKAGDEVGLVKLVRKVKDFVAQIPAYVGFTVREDVVLINDEPLPTYLGKRLKAFADSGAPYEYLLKFWDNLKKNPSYRSVQSLYNFLENTHCPINKDGYILCYKAVTHDWKDKWTQKIDNSLGQEPSMARNLISDDPDVACGPGLHAGSFEYAKGYASGNDRIIEVVVNPAKVVSVPKDCAHGKMRVETYLSNREMTEEIKTEVFDMQY